MKLDSFKTNCRVYRVNKCNDIPNNCNNNKKNDCNFHCIQKFMDIGSNFNGYIDHHHFFRTYVHVHRTSYIYMHAPYVIVKYVCFSHKWKWNKNKYVSCIRTAIEFAGGQREKIKQKREYLSRKQKKINGKSTFKLKHTIKDRMSVKWDKN